MTSRYVKATMAALNEIATPPHLRAQQGITPTPAAGAGPQSAAPLAADPGFSWDEVVAEHNARNGLGQPRAAAPISGTVDHTPAASQASHSSETIDWDAAVATINAENGCTHPGANPDPRLAAMLSGKAGR